MEPAWSAVEQAWPAVRDAIPAHVIGWLCLLLLLSSFLLYKLAHYTDSEPLSQMELLSSELQETVRQFADFSARVDTVCAEVDRGDREAYRRICSIQMDYIQIQAKLASQDKVKQGMVKSYLAHCAKVKQQLQEVIAHHGLETKKQKKDVNGRSQSVVRATTPRPSHRRNSSPDGLDQLRKEFISASFAAATDAPGPAPKRRGSVNSVEGRGSATSTADKGRPGMTHKRVERKESVDTTRKSFRPFTPVDARKITTPDKRRPRSRSSGTRDKDVADAKGIKGKDDNSCSKLEDNVNGTARVIKISETKANSLRRVCILKEIELSKQAASKRQSQAENLRKDTNQCDRDTVIESIDEITRMMEVIKDMGLNGRESTIEEETEEAGTCGDEEDVELQVDTRRGRETMPDTDSVVELQEANLFYDDDFIELTDSTSYLVVAGTKHGKQHYNGGEKCDGSDENVTPLLRTVRESRKSTSVRIEDGCKVQEKHETILLLGGRRLEKFKVKFEPNLAENEDNCHVQKKQPIIEDNSKFEVKFEPNLARNEDNSQVQTKQPVVIGDSSKFEVKFEPNLAVNEDISQVQKKQPKVAEDNSKFEVKFEPYLAGKEYSPRIQKEQPKVIENNCKIEVKCEPHLTGKEDNFKNKVNFEPNSAGKEDECNIVFKCEPKLIVLKDKVKRKPNLVGKEDDYKIEPKCGEKLTETGDDRNYKNTHGALNKSPVPASRTERDSKVASPAVKEDNCNTELTETEGKRAAPCDSILNLQKNNEYISSYFDVLTKMTPSTLVASPSAVNLRRQPSLALLQPGKKAQEKPPFTLDLQNDLSELDISKLCVQKKSSQFSLKHCKNSEDVSGKKLSLQRKEAVDCTHAGRTVSRIVGRLCVQMKAFKLPSEENARAVTCTHTCDNGWKEGVQPEQAARTCQIKQCIEMHLECFTEIRHKKRNGCVIREVDAREVKRVEGTHRCTKVDVSRAIPAVEDRGRIEKILSPVSVILAKNVVTDRNALPRPVGPTETVVDVQPEEALAVSSSSTESFTTCDGEGEEEPGSVVEDGADRALVPDPVRGEPLHFSQVGSKQCYLEARRSADGLSFTLEDLRRGRHSVLTFNAAVAAELARQLTEDCALLARLRPADPRALASGGGNIKSFTINSGADRYYVDLKENLSGRFLCLSHRRATSAILARLAIPAEHMAGLRDDLALVLRQHATA